MSAKRCTKLSLYKRDKKYKRFKNIYKSKYRFQLVRKLPLSIVMDVPQALSLAKV